MVGLQSAAALAALLAGVVVALVYCLAPSGCFPRFALAFSGKRRAVLPVGVLFWMVTQKVMAATFATKDAFAKHVLPVCAWSQKLFVAVIADEYVKSTLPRWIAGTAIRFEETFTGAVFAATSAQFSRQSLKRRAAHFTGALDFVFFRLGVAGVGAILALCARGIVKRLAAVRANGLNGFHITLLAQGVGLLGAGRFVAKNEGSGTLIRHYLAPQIHYTTGGA